MKGVYRVNYIVMDEDVSFADYFYVNDMEEMKESINELLDDYDVDKSSVIVDDDAIHGIGTIYDVMVTVEAVNILGSDSLATII